MLSNRPTHTPRIPHRSLAALLRGRPGYRAVDWVERRAFARRVPFLARRSGPFVVQRHGRVLQIVEVEPAVTGRSVAARNLDLIVEVCTGGGIPYFLVPEPNAMRFRIGVRSEAWGRLVAALLHRGKREPIYAGVLGQSRHGARLWADLTIHPRIANSLAGQTALEIFRPVTPARGVDAFGIEWACLVERWRTEPDGRLQAPDRNERADFVAESLVSMTKMTQIGREVTTVDVFTHRHVFEVDFPVDVVYLWVDGADPQWRSRKRAAEAAAGVGTYESDAITDARFRDGDELRYSMRSLEQFAPWVRHVYLVTDRQVPSWLATDHPDITLVDHQELFGGSGKLPTFNSHAIGARLHHIPGLAEHYLYLNDDVFLGRDVAASFFFDSNGTTRFFLSRTSLGFDNDAGPSHECARRNVVNLLARDFGRTPTNTFFHAPIPQRRSVMLELEQRYRSEFETTWSNQFRARTDIEPNSWLHGYYAYLTGRATPGRIRYAYFRVGDPASERGLERLFKTRDRDTFCINDHSDASEAHRAYVAHWLSEYFPIPSRLERSRQRDNEADE